MIKDVNYLKQPSQMVRLGGTRLGSARLTDKVYYKEVYFHLVHPVWIKKFSLCIVRPVVTWVQTLNKSGRGPTLMESYH